MQVSTVPSRGPSHRGLTTTREATLQAGTVQEAGLVTHSACLVGRKCPPGRLQPKFQMEEAAGGGLTEAGPHPVPD